MEITYENFLAFVKGKVKSDRAKAALIKNKAIQVIQEFSANNPAYYERLRERLERIIQEEIDRRKKNADYFTNPELYEEIYNLAINEEKERQKVFGNYQATSFEFAVYGELLSVIDDRKRSIDLTKALFSKLEPETKIVGWKTKTSSEKNMKSIIYDTLNSNKISEDKIAEISERIITLAKNRL
jgi:type I restriction enzyme R subunit